MANEKRLIDVEQAKRATYEEIFWTESEQAVVRNFLAKLPKVDAVEVVRCKDCAYYLDEYAGERIGFVKQCETFQFYTKENDFCSFGWRKNNERKAD